MGEEKTAILPVEESLEASPNSSPRPGSRPTSAKKKAAEKSPKLKKINKLETFRSQLFTQGNKVSIAYFMFDIVDDCQQIFLDSV